MKKYRNIWDTNRTSSQRGKGTTSWCHGCDMNLVRDGEKCKVCGYTHKKHKLKLDKKEFKGFDE